MTHISGKWSDEKHNLFIKGVLQYGNNWKKLSTLIITRTAPQIRTHAQKFIIKLSQLNGISFVNKDKALLNTKLNKIFSNNQDVANVFYLLRNYIPKMIKETTIIGKRIRKRKKKITKFDHCIINKIKVMKYEYRLLQIESINNFTISSKVSVNDFINNLKVVKHMIDGICSHSVLKQTTD